AEHFKSKSMRFGLNQMTLSDFADWLDQNPDIKIVTDIKGSNIDGLEAIKSALQDQTDQIIPQIYTRDEYAIVRSLGFEAIIFTAYRSSLDTSEILEFAQSHTLFAVTIPHSGINQDWQEWLNAMPVPVLAHTVNNKGQAADLIEWGVSGFYTDYLIPAEPEL
ncbi:MAG: hypothetical protein AAGH90_05310, partial [Pseudomonadota bacterium]